MATKKFTRVEATQEQIEAAKKSKFFESFNLPNNLEVEIEKYTYIAFESNGKKSEKATPVITLKGREEVIYFNSLKKERTDFDGNPVSHIGEINKFVCNLSRTFNLDEAMTETEKKFPVGTKILVHLVTYFGRDRNGDGRNIQYNEYSSK